MVSKRKTKKAPSVQGLLETEHLSPGEWFEWNQKKYKCAWVWPDGSVYAWEDGEIALGSRGVTVSGEIKHIGRIDSATSRWDSAGEVKDPLMNTQTPCAGCNSVCKGCVR